jgi:HK97 gp10 family phage protein
VNASLEITGTDEVAKALKAYGKRAEDEIAKAVTATALQVDGDIKKAIQRGAKSGRVYVRRGKSHQASAPGQAPATDTGSLVSSIKFKQVTRLTAEVESRLAYAAFLEFGTQRMAARPAWVPAIEKARPDFARRVSDAIRRAAP